jgi:SAM-dependent methyltransferase
MDVRARLRRRIKASRKSGAMWVRLLDLARLLATAEGRSVAWTRLAHGAELHQTTAQTAENRYPELFAFVAEIHPGAQRILSFGCSTGAELAALRQRFPEAEIVGAEINSRSRRAAARRMKDDPRVAVTDGRTIEGSFDAIFALAVLQREPHKVVELDVRDLSAHYPFERFDAAVCRLAALLRPGGLLCVSHAHYRVEDSSAAPELELLPAAPRMDGPLFGPDGRRIDGVRGGTVFRSAPRRKRPPGANADARGGA